MACFHFCREPLTSALLKLLKQSPATKEMSKSLSAELHRLDWTQTLCQIMLSIKFKKGNFWWLSDGLFRGNYLK